MRRGSVVFLMGGLFLLLAASGTSQAQEEKEKEKKKFEMVDNPVYVHWATFKPGATVTRRDKIKFPKDSEDGHRYHEHTLIKDITYKLIEVTKEKAVVEVIEAEHGRGSIQESSPVKISYFAKMRSGLGIPKESFAKHKQEEVEVTIHGKMYKATLVDTVHKIGDVTRTHQVWLSDEIPGGILKDFRSQKEGDKLISESTLEIVSFKVP